MAAFAPDADPSDLAYSLMMNSFITLFWRPALLEETTEALRAQSYDIVHLDALTWTTEQDLHQAFASALDFPAYYGHNLDALHDCLGDVAAYAYGTTPQATGLVLVITAYDTFTATNPAPAQTTLDIFAAQARAAALTGHRMMCLIQTNNPTLKFTPVGATPIPWNPAESLTTSRHPPDHQ
ncbi:barstar family protein [Spirillospora sp. CA-294931]|uniref:barstar family protein n=1 Tax=Spirillospora sp. CA-294931 TaxID=3240042 RepID=UPI003D8EF0C1